MNKKKYKRFSTNITISNFYEQHCLKKFNYDPEYQRDYNVWDIDQKSFLIDTIYKNFPMPPVFLEQKIVKGKTFYDVIDGKQRLNAIVDFINNKLPLPKDFGDDIYGNSKLNGKYFKEVLSLAEKDDEISEYVDIFWSYIINIEYIEKPDDRIVDNIFDRLNRGGERLNPAELRKAKYYDTALYICIEDLAKESCTNKLLKHLDRVRLQHISFLTEIFLLIKTKSVINGVEKDIDELFEKLVEEIDMEEGGRIKEEVIKTINCFNSFGLNLEKYKIEGTSHTFALLYLALYLNSHSIEVDSAIKDNLNEFYTLLRNHSNNQFVEVYSKSMQSASKYKHSRKKRVLALLGYLGFKDIEVAI